LVLSDPKWQDRIHRYAPMEAGLAIQATRNLDTLPISPWAGFAVLAGYATALLLTGACTFLARDA
jgi:ABC-2 type transport system permease protein